MLVTAANVSRLTAHIPLKQVLVKTGQKKRYTPVMLWAFKFPPQKEPEFFLNANKKRTITHETAIAVKDVDRSTYSVQRKQQQTL